LRVVVGLGNPGFRYVDTRHNMGYRVVEKVASKLGIQFFREEGVLLGEGMFCKEPFFLVKATTFMNQSGPAVAALMKRKDFPLSQLIVVQDDLDLPFGRIRIKTKGGDGGHNGIRSLITFLGAHHFIRLKIGIGRPQEFFNPVDYVLTTFSFQEKDDLEELFERGSQALLSLVSDGTQKAMNRYHSEWLK